MRKEENNFKNSHGFEFVSYIYGELDQAGEEAIETHLVECDECTMELASYSDARLGVIEWRREDFDPLATPAFVIPSLNKHAFSGRTGTRSGTVISRFVESLIALPLFGKAGLGAAAAAMVIALFYFGVDLRTGPTSIAVNENVENKNARSNSDPAIGSTSSTLVAGTDEKHKAIDTKDRPTLKSQPRQLIAARFTLHRPMSRKNEMASKDAVPRTSSKKAPRLSSTDEDDDKTLRLADLLADIGTSEE